VWFRTLEAGSSPLQVLCEFAGQGERQRRRAEEVEDDYRPAISRRERQPMAARAGAA
jgi:hypothetical protein